MPALKDVLTVRRSSQSERAYEADLIVEGPGVPSWLCDLWIECQHANDPDPDSKYAQAIRDSNLALRRTGRPRTPCVIWRKTRSRSLWFTTQLAYLTELLGLMSRELPQGRAGDLLVTVPLSELLSALGSRLG